MKLKGPFLHVSLLVVLIGGSGRESGEDVSMVFVQDVINCFIFTHEIYNFVLPIKICNTLLICHPSFSFVYASVRINMNNASLNSSRIFCVEKVSP